MKVYKYTNTVENLKKYYDFESKFKPISINIINDILELEKLGIEKIDVKIKKKGIKKILKIHIILNKILLRA